MTSAGLSTELNLHAFVINWRDFTETMRRLAEKEFNLVEYQKWLYQQFEEVVKNNRRRSNGE